MITFEFKSIQYKLNTLTVSSFLQLTAYAVSGRENIFCSSQSSENILTRRIRLYFPVSSSIVHIETDQKESETFTGQFSRIIALTQQVFILNTILAQPVPANQPAKNK